MHPEAQTINEIIKVNSPQLFDLLTSLGRNAYYPNLGVTTQNEEAKHCKINAVRGQAFDDEGQPLVPDGLLEAINSISKKSFLYSSPYGHPQLRKVWRQRILQNNPSLSEEQISLPVVTNGLTQGLSIAYQLFVGENDPVVTPDLYWENYEHTFRDVPFATFPFYSGKGFNVKGLEGLIEPRGKHFLLLAFPSNPTGYALTKQETDNLTKMILRAAERGSSLVVGLDDAYTGLIHEQNHNSNSVYNKLVDSNNLNEQSGYPYSLFNKLANLHERVLTIKIDGASKELSSWGLRVGFITFGSKALMPETAKCLEDKAASIVRGDTSAVPTPSQELVLQALQNPQLESQLNEIKKVLAGRYQLIKNSLTAHPEYTELFEPMPFNSGYFMSLVVKGVQADKVRKTLLKNYFTGVLYFPKNNLRISYPSVKTNDIPILFENIYQACKEIYLSAGDNK